MFNSIKLLIVGLVASLTTFLYGHPSNSPTPSPVPIAYSPAITQQQKPSDRALKIAAWVFTHTSTTQVDEIIKQDPVTMKVFSQSQGKVIDIPAIVLPDGTITMPKTTADKVTVIATILDKNPANLALIEQVMEKTVAQENKPVINYHQPAPAIQIPVVQPVTQTYPKNCISNTIGNYTYTNCY